MVSQQEDLIMPICCKLSRIILQFYSYLLNWQPDVQMHCLLRFGTNWIFKANLAVRPCAANFPGEFVLKISF